MIKHRMNRVAAGLTVLVLLAAIPLKATPVTVQELGIGANEIVTISSSTLGSNLSVYAGVVDLSVNGVPTDGFCIDPFHWSISGPQAYDLGPLAGAPKPPGPMGDATALKIEQLWQQYFTPSIGNTQAAGLQIAIWELVAGSVSGATFSLNSGNDYGAGDMLAWVNNNPSAPSADLVGVSGPGQDYVIPNVPDGGLTAALLGIGLLALCLVRQRAKAVCFANPA
jgi:hypothetical protein